MFGRSLGQREFRVSFQKGRVVSDTYYNTPPQVGAQMLIIPNLLHR